MSTYQKMLETVPTTSESWSNPIYQNTHADVFSTHQTTSTQPAKQGISAFIESSGPTLKAVIQTIERHRQSASDLLALRPQWQDTEYRQAYAEAAVEQGIAWQVRVNRERRGFKQSELAAKIGTKQSAISRMEDPEYGSHSLQQLVKVAHAFDCALLVKFVSYSVLARESECLSPDQLFTPSYAEETGATL